MLLKLLQAWLNWKASESPSPGDTPEGGGGQLLCSSAASLETTRIHLVPRYLRHIKLQRKNIIPQNIQSPKASEVCASTFFTCFSIYRTPMSFCILCLVTPLAQDPLYDAVPLSSFGQLSFL